MLCPVRQLQLYLRDTERIWGGGVVKEAYTRADLEYDDDIRARELRAIASSWAYINQVRLEDILAAAALGAPQEFSRGVISRHVIYCGWHGYSRSYCSRAARGLYAAAVMLPPPYPVPSSYSCPEYLMEIT